MGAVRLAHAIDIRLVDGNNCTVWWPDLSLETGQEALEAKETVVSVNA